MKFWILIGFTTMFWIACVVMMLVADSDVDRFFTSVLVVILMIWGIYFLISKTTPEHKAGLFLLNMFSLMVIFGMFESLTLLKIADYRKVFHTPIIPAWLKPDNVLDPELIYKHRPYSGFSGESSGMVDFLFSGTQPSIHHYDVKYDKNGFRNREDLNQADIAVIGDSFVEGAESSFDSILTSLLSRAHNKTVANLGLIAYGPRQYAVVLRKYALPLKPKLVIWCFYEGNDLENIKDYDNFTRNWKKFADEAHSFSERSFIKNFYLALRRIFFPYKRPPATTRVGRIRTMAGDSVNTYFLYPSDPLDRDMEYSFLLFIDILKDAQKSCREAGAEFLLVFIPTKYRVYQGLMRVEKNSPINRWYLSNLPERLAELGREKVPGLRFLNLTPAMREAVRRGEIPYLLDDPHWSTAGHRIAASEIDTYLRNEFPVD